MFKQEEAHYPVEPAVRLRVWSRSSGRETHYFPPGPEASEKAVPFSATAVSLKTVHCILHTFPFSSHFSSPPSPIFCDARNIDPYILCFSQTRVNWKSTPQTDTAVAERSCPGVFSALLPAPRDPQIRRTFRSPKIRRLTPDWVPDSRCDMLLGVLLGRVIIDGHDLAI